MYRYPNKEYVGSKLAQSPSPVCATVLPKNGHVGCAGILAMIDQRVESVFFFSTVQDLVHSDAGAVSVYFLFSF